MALVIADTGYQSLNKLHVKTKLSKKRTYKHLLTKQERRSNTLVASQRMPKESVIAMLKGFRILSDRYRNRRKRFGLRLNLVAAIHNYELST
jgi:hypothetical protein